MWALSCLVLVVSISLGVHGAIPLKERAALMDFYNDCDGVNWKTATNWTRGDPCEEGWFGVTCNELNTHITQLHFNPNNSGNVLKGTIPESIGDFSELTQIYMSNDDILGIGGGTSKLKGTIPDTIGKLTKLECFYVSHGKLTGSLPAVMSNMTTLRGLMMRWNKFSGPLPDLTKLTKLNNFWLDWNTISGPIAGRLPESLVHLHFENNRFTGPIPSFVCDIESCHLSVGNNWTCPLPTTPCCDVNTCTGPNLMTSGPPVPVHKRTIAGQPADYPCKKMKYKPPK